MGVGWLSRWHVSRADFTMATPQLRDQGQAWPEQSEQDTASWTCLVSLPGPSVPAAPPPHPTCANSWRDALRRRRRGEAEAWRRSWDTECPRSGLETEQPQMGRALLKCPCPLSAALRALEKPYLQAEPTAYRPSRHRHTLILSSQHPESRVNPICSLGQLRDQPGSRAGRGKSWTQSHEA